MYGATEFTLNPIFGLRLISIAIREGNTKKATKRGPAGSRLYDGKMVSREVQSILLVVAWAKAIKKIFKSYFAENDVKIVVLTP